MNPDWQRYVPIIQVVREYRREDLGSDLVAGLIVGVVTVPQAVAYAFLAGLPAEAGLYACLVPMVLYAILGSSRQLVVGPVAIAALMVAATVSEHATAGTNDYARITTLLCVEVGLTLWMLRIFRLGGVVNILSHPVISGFVNGAAILIIVSQLPAFTGIHAANGLDAVASIMSLVSNVATFNPVALAVGLCSLLALWALPRLGVARHGTRAVNPVYRTGPMFVAVGAIAAVSIAGFELDTVGYVPPGLPALTLPPFDPALWIELAPPSVLIALVAYVESFSIGAMLASRQRRRINSHQELIALGAANVGAALTGAYPVAGSFSRSSVNFAAGGRTPIGSLFCAVLIVITLIWLTPFFEQLPHSALAAIIIVSVAGLLDFRVLDQHWRFYRLDVATHIVTLAGVLLLGVEAGLVTGVFISIMLFVHRSSRPHIAIVGRLGDTAHFRNVERYDVETWPEVVAVRVDESLYFANANRVEDRLLRVLQYHPEAHQIVLVCSAINFIDTSGLEMLRRVNDSLQRAEITLHLSEIKGPVMDQLVSIDFAAELSGRVFFTTDQAMRELSPKPAE